MDEVNAIVFFLGMMSGGFLVSIFMSLFMVTVRGNAGWGERTDGGRRIRSRPFRHCGKSCCKIVVSITGARIAVGSCIPANGTGCMTNSGSGSASATMSEPARRTAARNVKILSERR